MKDDRQDEYVVFQSKIMWRILGNAMFSIAVVLMIYLFFWKHRVGDWIVWLLSSFSNISHEEAFIIYHEYIRGNKDIFLAIAILVIFIFMLWRLFRWMTGYFREINNGIDCLLQKDDEKISLSEEMRPFERKLNLVKQTLQQQKADAIYAEKRKDELVMYLAHDIRTPLTSIIGYLNLLKEEPHMSIEKRAKYVHITLDKAYRLEEMINEFFEITRYNSRQISLLKKTIDLYYMLIQLSDELSPIFSLRGNTVLLDIDEQITIYADAEKIARVFSNILKNATTYSYPNTPIIISTKEDDGEVTIFFKNKGSTIPSGELNKLFDKFYRSDKARSSDTGGTGLGLAIAREIMLLHGGKIYAESFNNEIIFCVQLPKMNELVQL